MESFREMSTETSMELDGEYSSNVSNSTDAIIKGTGTCYSTSGCGLSLISDPNIASLSSSSTSSGDDSIFVSGASSSRFKQQSDHHQQEIRIFNVDFRALSTGVAVCNNNNYNTCSNKEVEVEEGSCATGSESLLAKYATDSNLIRYGKIDMRRKGKSVPDISLRKWMNLQKKENGQLEVEVEEGSCAAGSESLLAKYATDSNLIRYGKIDMQRKGKYVPDISLRRWMNLQKKENGQLLEQNAHALDQISANFEVFKIQENVNLFCQARNNILTILNDLNVADIMNEMPPLPVKVNDELANSILQRPPLNNIS